MRRRARRRRPLRVAYVVNVPADGRPPLDVLDAHPDAVHLLRALAAERLWVTAVWRTRTPGASVVWRGTTHRFVPDDRLGLRAARAVRAGRPDVVHVNAFLDPVRTLVLRLACPRARFVVQHHGEAPVRAGRAAVAQRLVGRTVQAAAFTGADEQAGPWRAAGVLPRRVRAHEVLEAAPSVAPLPRAEARGRTGVTGEPAVLWVGRLIEGKDPVGAVRAFARAFADRPAARLWLLCTNRDREADVRAAVAAAGVTDRTTLVGPVPHHEVAAWLSAADLFLATSRREGSGYALLEAVACGCTPVVSDIGPHRAIVGDDGVRFAVGDDADAARALRAAADAPIDRAVLRCRSATAHSWAAVARQLVAVYRGA